MIAAAKWPRQASERARIVRVSPDNLSLGTEQDLVDWFVAGDVLVLNDAASIPASIVMSGPRGTRVEVRLLEAPEQDHAVCRAVLFGEGDWHLPTELRTHVAAFSVGDRLSADSLRATVVRVDQAHQRWITLQFDGTLSDILQGLYRVAKPIQYSYLSDDLSLWHVQTPMATRPVAVEAPSSGYLLHWDVLSALRAKGVILAVLTHATGLSSTGEPVLDARLPIDERYEISQETVQLIVAAQRENRRVIAVGTGVMRALEDCFTQFGALVPGAHVAALKLGPEHPARVVSGVLTGVHEEGSSHAQLLKSLFSQGVVARALEYCAEHSLKGHEFGDGTLWL